MDEPSLSDAERTALKLALEKGAGGYIFNICYRDCVAYAAGKAAGRKEQAEADAKICENVYGKSAHEVAQDDAARACAKAIREAAK